MIHPIRCVGHHCLFFSIYFFFHVICVVWVTIATFFQGILTAVHSPSNLLLFLPEQYLEGEGNGGED